MVRFRSKIYTTGMDKYKFQLQGNTVEINSKDIQGKTLQETLDNFAKTKQDMIAGWVRNMKGLGFVQAESNGNVYNITEMKGAMSSSWRNKIADKINFDVDKSIIKEAVQDAVKETRKPLLLRVVDEVKYSLEFRKKQESTRVVARDSRGRFTKKSLNLDQLL